jgi:hypothetical protein
MAQRHGLLRQCRGWRWAAVAIALTAGAVEGAEVSMASCAAAPNLVGPCFSVRGRLSLWNGTPSARIWRVGTKRILGVSDSRCIEPDCRQLPADILAALDWDTEIFADFLVCPFTKERPGVMQFVCAESARNVSVRNRE